MTPEEFVKLFYHEKTDFFNEYFSKDSDLAVTKLIESLDFTSEQLETMKSIVDGILDDVFYTILLGIDGEANIGGKQIDYKLFDEEGNELTVSGRIEAAAGEIFQGN